MQNIFYLSSEGIKIDFTPIDTRIDGQIQTDGLDYEFDVSEYDTFSLNEVESTGSWDMIVLRAIYSGETESQYLASQPLDYFEEHKPWVFDVKDIDTIIFDEASSTTRTYTYTVTTPQTPYTMLTETDMFNWEWEYETIGLNFPHISAFKNQMKSKSMSLVVKGDTEEEMLKNLDRLVGVIDRDVRIQEMGRFYVGDYYLEGYFIANTKEKVFNKNQTTIALTFLAENGNWQNDTTFRYSGLTGTHFVNEYAVPTINDSTNFTYDRQEEFTSSFDFVVGSNLIEIGSAQTITLNSYTKHTTSSQYPTLILPNGTTVGQITSYPYTVDVSNFRPDQHITLTLPSGSGTGTMQYKSTPMAHASRIEWMPSRDNASPKFTLDLGANVTITSISGLIIRASYDVGATGEVYLETSLNGTDWSYRDSKNIPSTADGEVELSASWGAGEHPTIRYIRVTTREDIIVYSINTNKFKIRAESTAETQNLASQCQHSYDPSLIWSINTNGEVGFSKTVRNIETEQGVTIILPRASTIRQINNIHLFFQNVPNHNYYHDGDYAEVEIYFRNDKGEIIYEDIERVSFGHRVVYSFDDEAENVKEIVMTTNKIDFMFMANDLEILTPITDDPVNYIDNINYAPSECIIDIYGPVAYPSITIGDNQYGAENLTIEDGEVLEINTKERTMRHFTDPEGWVNVYHKRLPSSFEKVEAGSQEILWAGTMPRLDVTLLGERSDPKWS